MKIFRKQYVPLLLLIVLGACTWAFGLVEYLSIDELRKHHTAIRQFVNYHYNYALLFYMLLYVFVVSISLPGATLMTLVGGFYFGQVIGTVAVVVSATIGATILFVCVKFATIDFADRHAAVWAKKMQVGFSRDAFSYLLALRLIPLFPFFAVNLAAAFLRVRLWIFFLATFIGIIPGTFIYITLGSGLQDFADMPVMSSKLIFGLVGLGVIALLPIAYKRLFRD